MVNCTTWFFPFLLLFKWLLPCSQAGWLSSAQPHRRILKAAGFPRSSYMLLPVKCKAGDSLQGFSYIYFPLLLFCCIFSME